MVNALELAEELQARTDFSERDARGVVYAISRATETATAKLITADQLDARMAELRAEFAELRGEVRSEIASVRTEIAELRAETKMEIASVRTEIAELRVDTKTEIASVRTEIAALRVEMHQAIRAQTIWLSSTMIAIAGVMIAAIKFIP